MLMIAYLEALFTTVGYLALTEFLYKKKKEDDSDKMPKSSS